MASGRSPSSAWRWSKRGQFFPTQAACSPDIFRPPPSSTSFSSPTTTPSSTSSLMPSEPSWPSSRCSSCWGWSAQVRMKWSSCVEGVEVRVVSCCVHYAPKILLHTCTAAFHFWLTTKLGRSVCTCPSTGRLFTLMSTGSNPSYRTKMITTNGTSCDSHKGKN